MSDTVNESEVEAEVVRLAAEASRAYFAFIGAASRAQNAATIAEAAGVTGARNLLPAAVREVDPKSAAFLERVGEPVRRGLIGADEANRLLNGQ